MSKSVDQDPLNNFSSEEEFYNNIDPSDVNNIMDNATRNSGKISEAMRFSSEGAASAFKSITDILNGKETNEDKKKLILGISGVVQDTALQVFANMAIGMLGSSTEVGINEKEAPGIEKLSEAFVFLGREIDNKEEFPKDKRLQDMVGAYASLMTNTEIDEGTKKSIDNAFKQTPEIIEIAKIQAQEGEENKGEKESEKSGDVKKNSTEYLSEDLKDSSTYDGKDWEDFKSKAILSAKGAIAIGLLFAPGGIFLAPLFLYATKNFGRNPNEIDKEQKDAETAKLESEKSSKILNAFKKYLSGPEEVKQNEVDEQQQKEDLEVQQNKVDEQQQKEDPEVENNPSIENQSIQKESDDKRTHIGEEAEEVVKTEDESLIGNKETLKVNKEALKRVAADLVDAATVEALAKIGGGLSAKQKEEMNKDKEVHDAAKGMVDEVVKAAVAAAGIFGALDKTKMQDVKNGDVVAGLNTPQVDGVKKDGRVV